MYKSPKQPLITFCYATMVLLHEFGIYYKGLAGTVDWCTASDLSKRSQGQFPCSIFQYFKIKVKELQLFQFYQEMDQICITTSVC